MLFLVRGHMTLGGEVDGHSHSGLNLNRGPWEAPETPKNQFPYSEAQKSELHSVLHETNDNYNYVPLSETNQKYNYITQPVL